jgi:tRNA pseudouridine55 synthase
MQLLRPFAASWSPEVRNPVEIDGALVVDKPSGPTSHDIVGLARRSIGCKVGHTGTLDPAATGVLVLLLGRATRLSQFMLTSDKEYLARIRLGIVTDTYDAEGRVLEENPVPQISPEKAEQTLSSFRGDILQVPPMYSAIKVAGEPLYKAARRSEEVDRPAREVTVYGLILEEQASDIWTIWIHCSSGTYIRSIAHDLGQALGCGARIEELRRTRSGQFTVDRAISVDLIRENWPDGFVPMEELLPEFCEVAVDPEQARRVVNGNPVSLSVKDDTSTQREGKLRITYDGRLIAIGDAEQDTLKPRIVLRQELK